MQGMPFDRAEWPPVPCFIQRALPPPPRLLAGVNLCKPRSDAASIATTAEGPSDCSRLTSADAPPRGASEPLEVQVLVVRAPAGTRGAPVQVERVRDERVREAKRRVLPCMPPQP